MGTAGGWTGMPCGWTSGLGGLQSSSKMFPAWTDIGENAKRHARVTTARRALRRRREEMPLRIVSNFIVAP
jgi:hypothetical protein